MIFAPLTEIVRPPRTCAHCGKPFDKARMGANYYKQKYCSQVCMGKSYRATPDRFWEKVDKSAGPDGCWPYMGFRKWDGYGWLARTIDGKQKHMTAHRCAWILTQGFPPEGMHLLHKCDNPPCCNPTHLRLGTHDENMDDMRKRGRNNSGQIKKYKPVLHPNRVRPKRAA